MAVQEERVATASAPPDRDDAWPLVADDLDLEAMSTAPPGNDAGRLALASAACDECGVNRIGRDKSGREVDDLVHGAILTSCVDERLPAYSDLRSTDGDR
jgi:hypothetical protein